MKKILMVLVLMPFLVLAKTETVGGITWTYTVSDGQASVGGGSSSSTAVPKSTTGAIEIPLKLGGYSVTRICDSAFYGCSKLTSVTIPQNVVSVGDSAFYGCSELRSVKLLQSVTNIGDYAFSECRGLTSLVFATGTFSITYGGGHTEVYNYPPAVERIGTSAFAGCSSLTSVTIPPSVKDIGKGAFTGCSGLTSMILPFVGAKRGDSGVSSSLFGYIFGSVSYSGGVLTKQYYSSANFSSFYIPSSLRNVEITDETSLGYGAFYGCSGLTRVVISATVTYIGKSVFSGCSNLASMVLPFIGENRGGSGDQFSMFGYVFGIESYSGAMKTKLLFHNTGFYIPMSLRTVEITDETVVGYGAFYGCSELTSTILPSSIVSINSEAYYGCSGLTSVTIPSSVTSIGREVFCGCNGLTSIKIPSKVTSIGTHAFMDCAKLSAIEVESSNANFASIDGILFDKAGTKLIACPSAKKGSYTIPSSVTTVVESAFFGCKALSTVMIPSSVTSVEASAFEGCLSLSSIWFEHYLAPSVSDSAFSGVLSSCVAYVKRSSTGWGVEVPGRWKGINIDCATYDVILIAQGGSPSTAKVVVDMGDPYGELPIPTKKGYSFDGWYTTRAGGVKVLASDIPQGATTLYAHWATIPYVITYSELHGARNPNPTQYTIESRIIFSVLENQSGRKFVGWSPASIPLGTVGDVNVTALWQDVVVNDVLGETASTGGDANWFVSWDGANPILRSGTIVKKQSSWMEMSFEDAARVSFEWKASCEDLGGASERTDGMTVTIDGVELGFICGETGWIAATNLVAGEGTHKIRWTYAKDAKTDVGEDCAWVRNVTVTPLRSASFDAGGAEAGIAPEAISTYVGDRYALPDNGSLKKAKHSFMGWKFGDDVLAAGMWCVMPPSNVTYAAVWSAKVLDAPCITVPSIYDEESTLVSISAAEGTTIYYTLDGSVPSANNGIQYMGAFRVTGTVKVMTVAVRDDWYDSAVAQMTTTRSWTTLEDSLGVDDEEFTITTGGTANWIGDKANACVKSAGEGWLKAAFVGPCVVAWEERTGAGNWSAKHQVFAEEGVREIIWEGASLSVRGLQRLAVRRVDFACGEGIAGEVPQGTCPVSIYDAAGFPFELPSADGLSVPKHRFVGWKLGETVSAVGSQCVMPTYDVTYVGVWESKKLSAPVIDVASRYSTEKTVFSVSQQEGANVYYTLDGSDPSSEHGLRYSGVVEIEGSVTIRAIAVCDDWFASEVSSASTVRLPWSASECLNAADLTFEFGGDADWKRDLQESHDGVASMQSGTIGNYQKSEVRTTVTGSGELSFWCRASSECDESDGEPYDGMMVYVDDVVQGDLIGGNIQWTNVRLKVSGEGTHVVRWVYEKDKSGSGGRDCVWLDEVAWNPMLKPIIEGDEEATVTGDAETGFVIKPSEGTTSVEVTIPLGVDAAKVTVEVSPKVASVKPNGAKVKIVVGENDITGFLVIPESEGVLNIAAATVKEEIVKETLDPTKEAVLELNAANPQLITAPTRKGLTYTLYEGHRLESLSKGDSKLGDGDPWTPTIRVSGGDAAFYSIDVRK